MSKRVVDQLEPIEIHHQGGEASARALGECDSLRQTVFQQHTIGQPRQRIVRRLVMQSGVRFLQCHRVLACLGFQISVVENKDHRDRENG